MKQIFKQNPVKSYKQWKGALNNLTPLTYSQSKMWGHQWGAIGMILAFFALLYKGVWYFFIFILAMAYIQYIEYKKEKQSYLNLKEMMGKLKEEEGLE